MNLNGNLPFNWFDILVLITLLIGYAHGKKHGMSQEVVAVFKWVVLVVICAIAYEPLGLFISTTANLGKLTSYILAYIATATIIALIFAFVKRAADKKLSGSDTFGKAEFYLAMPAGMVRFTCVLLTLLALLNARFYATAEVKAMSKFQQDNYGSQFFPTLCSLQDDVFKNSFLGPQVQKYLSFLLIKPTPATPGGGTPASSGRSTVSRREFSLP